MSSNSESSSDPKFEMFKDNVEDFLQKSFIAFAVLFILAGMYYLSFLPQNVQNSLPLLLILFLGTFTWIMRAKILVTKPEDIRSYLIQWIIICSIVIIITVISVVLYPFSSTNILF